MNLTDLDAVQWSTLEAAVAAPEHAFRNVTLATIDADGQPQARYLVLRGVMTASRVLEMHTDTRSDKWDELAVSPKVTVLAYDAPHRTQLRLTGTATRHAPGDRINDAAWARLSPWARHTYSGGPPGVVMEWADMQVPQAPDEAGRDRFGVLTFKIAAMDWFQHPRGDIRRAQFDYGPDGVIIDARWIAP